MRYDASMPSLRTVTLLALLTAPAARAAGESPPADAPHPLQLEVGETLSLCGTGTVSCPPRAPRCDDLSVVAPEERSDGAAFRGLKPGTTLCSAAGGTVLGTRRVYRVTVVPRPDDRPR
jgi:hypothetical protein